MKIIDDIVEEVRKSKTDPITNIIVQYQDIEGRNFFEKIDSLRRAFNTLYKEHSLVLVEDDVVQNKWWEWDLPIYFDVKFHYLQFNLRRIEESHSDKEFTVECGSIWRRPVDGTIIEIQGISGKLIYVKVLDGPGIVGDTLNHEVLHIFWNKK